MQAVRQALERHLPLLSKNTYATATIVYEGGPGEFSVLVKWDESRAGPAGEHREHFTKERVFGATMQSPNPRPVKKMCQVRREIERAVMEVRT